jgi:hypothetical protein
VGLWDHFIAARASGLADAVVVEEALGQHDGWEFARLPPGISTLDAVNAAATALDVPAIAAWVADSDAAALSFASPSAESGWLSINRAYEDDDEEHTRRWLDPAAHRAAADALAAWTEGWSSKEVTGEAVVRALAELEDQDLGQELQERALVFAEDGLRAVWEDVLGLPSLDNAVFSNGSERLDILVVIPRASPDLAISLSEKLRELGVGEQRWAGPHEGAQSTFSVQGRAPSGRVADVFEAIEAWLAEHGRDSLWVQVGSEDIEVRARDI